MERPLSDSEAAFEELRIAKLELDRSIEQLAMLLQGLQRTDQVLTELLGKEGRDSPAPSLGLRPNARPPAPSEVSTKPEASVGNSWLQECAPLPLRRLAVWLGGAGSAVAGRLRPYWQRFR
jgi:hypothetical protein